jgi:hypothetical protein
MGMYDTFTGECPKCGAAFEAQTKMFDCCLHDFRLGDKVADDNYSWKYVLPDPCGKCRTPIVVTVVNGIVHAFDSYDETIHSGLPCPDGNRRAALCRVIKEMAEEDLKGC